LLFKSSRLDLPHIDLYTAMLRSAPYTYGYASSAPDGFDMLSTQAGPSPDGNYEPLAGPEPVLTANLQSH
jgi:hypothetical protein